MPLITDPLEYFKKEARATGSLIADPVNPFVKGATITGKEAEDYRLASGKYGDFNFTQINPQAVLDAKQPWSDVIVNGTTQFGARAATSFLGTVGGLITGGTQWLASGIGRGGDFRTSDFTMDYFSQGLNALDESIAKAMPIYQDPEDTRNWTQQLGDLDFWAGNVLPNLGFTAGAAAGVYATAGMGTFGLEGKLLQMAGKGLQGTKLAAATAQQSKNIGRLVGNIAKGFKTEKSLGDLARVTSPQLAGTIDDGIRTATSGKSAFAKQIYGTMVSTIGESKFEAVGTYNEMKQDLLSKGYDEDTADEYAKRAANADFFLNTLILGVSNYAQFGHLFGTGKTLKGTLASFIKGDLARGYTIKNLDTTLGKMLTSAPKWAQIPIKVGYAGGKAALGGLREGGEEWFQFMGNKVSKNYSQRVLDGFSGEFGGSMGAMLDGIQEEFGKSENRDFYGEAGENFFLGAIMGALGMPVNLKGKFAGGIVGAYQEETENRRLVADKNKQVQELGTNLENIRKKYGLDKLSEEIDPEGKMEAAELLTKMREAMGKNQAFKDAMIGYSFQKDATDAYESGDLATAKIMEAMGFAHDLITAETAGKGDEFLSFITSQDPVTAQEIRDFTAQQSKDGTLYPFAPLTDEVLEKKVEDNRRELTEKAVRIKEIHSKIKQIPGLSMKGAKDLTTMLAGVDDIEKRFEALLQPDSEVQKLISRLRPKEIDQIEEFDNFVNDFLNPSDIKQTLANISSSEDFAKFKVNAAAALSDMVQKGVVDLQSAKDAFSVMFDLGRSARTRSNILKAFNKIVADPENYGEWAKEQKEDTDERAVNKEIGKRMSSIWASNGFAVPENMFEVDKGEFFGKVGENLISIIKDGNKLSVQVNGEEISPEDLYQNVFNKDFVPLTKEQFTEAQEAVNVLKRQRKEERIVEEVLQNAIEEVETALEENNKLYEDLLKSKEPLLKRIESYRQDIAELQKEITTLAKTKNKFTKKDLPALEELLKETEALIDEITKEIEAIDSQINEVASKEQELENKKQFFQELLDENLVSLNIQAKFDEIKKLSENKGVRNLIETLQREKEELISMRDELTELFNELTEEENLIKVFDTLDAIDKRLAEIPALIEELRQNIYSEDGKRKFKYLGQIRANIKNRLKTEAQEVDDKSINKNNQPIAEKGIVVEYTDSAKKPIKIGFFTTTGNEAIDGTDTPTENEREKRWYGYINNTPKKDLKKARLLIFSKNSPYNDPEKLGQELHITDDETDLFVLVVDAKGDPIEDKGKFIWTSLHLPEPKGGKDRFSYPKDLDESQEEVLYLTAQKDYVAFRNKVIAQEKAGKKPLVKILDRSRGKARKEVKEGNNLLAATNHNIKWLPLEVVINGTATLPQSTVKDEPNGSIWTETTLGDPLYTTQNKLSQEDAETAFEIIKEILLNKNNKIEGRNIREILQKMIFVGKNSQQNYQIYFAKDSLFVRGARIDKVELDEQRDNIIAFLKTKLYNVDKGTLDKANEELKKGGNLTKFYKPVFKNGKITFEEFTTYKHFLVEQALKVYAPNFGESPTLNKYLQFNNELEGKPGAPKKGAKKGEVVDLGGNEETSTEVEDKIAEYRAQEEEEVKKIIPNIDEYKVDGVINKNKVLAGIEERKQEELKKAKNASTKIVEEAEPTGKKVFLGTPSKDGYFINKNVKTKFDEVENVYEFILTSDTTAKFKVHSHPEAIKSALRFPDKTIDPASTSLNAFNPSVDGIKTIKYGEAVLEGDKWVVKNKAEIEYTGGNTRPAQATSGVSVKAVEAKYKAQADAYNEIYDRYDKLITEADKGTTTETKSWRDIRNDFNYQAETFNLPKITSRNANTLTKALENVVENSSNATEIKLAKVALEQLNPSKKEQVSENIPTLDANAALADFADVYGLNVDPGTSEQNEQGEEVEEKCIGGKK